MADQAAGDRATQLSFDPVAATNHLQNTDPVLGALIARTDPINREPSPRPTSFIP